MSCAPITPGRTVLTARLHKYRGWTRGSNASPSASVPVRLGTWAGFIFLNLDAEAEPLETYLADLPDLARFKMEELRLGKRIEYEVAANWRLIGENYSECYHCRGASAAVPDQRPHRAARAGSRKAAPASTVGR